MKKYLLGVLTALAFFIVVGFISYKYVVDTTYDVIEKKLSEENEDRDKQGLDSTWSGLIGDGEEHLLKEQFKTKKEAVNSYPFLHKYLTQHSESNWGKLEIDWVVIQNAIDIAGENGHVSVPKPSVGYRINRPITLKQGQTIDFSPNTKIYDYTNDYAFKIVGGTKFPGDAVTHITLRNLDIVGNSSSYGAIKLKNSYLTNIENVKVSNYANPNAKGIYLQDFFQINLNTVQVNNIEKGKGIYVDSIEGNSGQLNLLNTIVQRSRIGIHVVGSQNLIDGINVYGGAVGNNYSRGVVVGKNVYNFNFIGSHFENHDGLKYDGTTAIDMKIPNGTSSESINFLGCIFINNKYAIQSNNTKRVTLSGNQFDGRNIKGSIAIKQGNGDASWTVNPNYFVNNDKNLMEAGKNHLNLSAVSINSKGVLYPQKNTAGVYSGSENPEGNVAAKTGSIYLRTDNSAEHHIYVKQSDKGNTGWRSLETR
jgi:hypothetical protein